MKKNIKAIFLLVLPLFIACEKQITVDVPTGEPKLVVDGWFTNESGQNGAEQLQTVRLSMSLPYFSAENYPLVKDATVILKDDKGNDFPMTYVVPTYYDWVTDTDKSEESKGRYELLKNLEMSVSYRLYIRLADGTEYESKDQKVISYDEVPRIYSEYKEADDYDFEEDGYYIGFEPKYIDDQDNYFIWQLIRYNEYNNDDGTVEKHESSYSDYLFGSSAYTSVGESDTYFNFTTSAGEQYFIKQFVVAKEVYDYMRLAEEQRDNEGTQFSPPPAPLRSNIEKIGRESLDDDALGLFIISSVQKSETITMP